MPLDFKTNFITEANTTILDYMILHEPHMRKKCLYLRVHKGNW